MRILAILLLCAATCHGAVFTPGSGVTLQQVTNIANAAAIAAGGPTNGVTASTVTNIATALIEPAFQAATNHSRNASNALRTDITNLQGATNSHKGRLDSIEGQTNAMGLRVTSLEGDVSDHSTRIDALESGGATQNTNTLPVFRATNIVADAISADTFNIGAMAVSNWVSFGGPVTNEGALYLKGISGSGSHLTVDGDGNVTKTTISGSTSFNETNITVSATNNIVVDLAAFDVVKIKLLTNLNGIVFSNASTMTERGQVYFQQDTNGQRTVTHYLVQGGLIQTNANMQPTTNANALDLLEVMPGFFSTNLLAWWPQNFQPRVAFTNSLASGGGGGGACNTEAQTFGSTGSFDAAADWTAATWRAWSFTASSSYTVCKAQVYLAKQGTPAAGTLEVMIYTDNAGSPGTLVGTGSATVNRTTISSSQSFVEFTGMNASLTSGTTYWRVIKASALDTDGSNRIYVQVDQTSETSLSKTSSDGSSWDVSGFNENAVSKLFN